MEKAAARQCATSGLTAFSHRLAKHFSAANNGNLVFSPLSIHSALSLVAAGANGRTLTELLALLGAGSRNELEANVCGMLGLAFPPAAQQKGGPRVSYACGIWHDSTRALKPAYRDLAAASFRSTVRAVDFRNKPEEARNEINSWVASATRNLIDSILGPGSANPLTTRLVVANAVYFKGSWTKPFDKSRTKKDKFRRLDGSVVHAQFMSSDCDQYIGVHNGFKVLRMPYAAAGALPSRRAMPSRYSMCVLLPDDRDGLQSLQDKIASSPGFLQDHMPERISEFRLRSRVELSCPTCCWKKRTGRGSHCLSRAK